MYTLNFKNFENSKLHWHYIMHSNYVFSLMQDWIKENFSDPYFMTLDRTFCYAQDIKHKGEKIPAPGMLILASDEDMKQLIEKYDVQIVEQ